VISINENAAAGTLSVDIANVGTYELYHGWKSGTDNWIDGKIVFAGGQPPLQLDIASLDEGSFTNEEFRAAVSTAWARGSVHAMPPENGAVLTLVVPGVFLTNDDVVEALKRFLP
jgi:hypothetical protein